MKENLVAWCAELAELAELAKQREVENLANNPAPKPIATIIASKVAQLPIWPEATRGIPNSVLRSALFSAVKRGSKQSMIREKIASLEGFSVVYTGTKLDQGDLDVWETLLHIARSQNLYCECRVSAYKILQLLGKSDSGGNRETLAKRLSKIKATAIEISFERFSYEGSLIDDVYKDQETREYVIKINPKLNILFGKNQFTQVDWGVRRLLDGKSLAQWLHGFYSSHAKPYPMKVETLHQLCGSDSANIGYFKKDLIKALNSMTKVCESFSYEIVNGLVIVEMHPSNAQKRHLIKKAKLNILKK